MNRKAVIVIIIVIVLFTGCSESKDAIKVDYKSISDMRLEETLEYEDTYLGASDDGKYIAFLNEDKFKVIEAETEDIISKEKIDEPIYRSIMSRRNAVWSPNGKYILFTTVYGTMPSELMRLADTDIYVYDLEEEEFIKILDIDEDKRLGDDDYELVYNPMWCPDNSIIYTALLSDRSYVKKITLENDEPEKLYKLSNKGGRCISSLSAISKDHILLVAAPSRVDEEKEVILYNIKEDVDEEIMGERGTIQFYIKDTSVNNRTVLIVADVFEQSGIKKEYSVIKFKKGFKEYDVISCDFDDHFIENAVLSKDGQYVIGKAFNAENAEYNYYIYNIEEDDVDKLFDIVMEDKDFSEYEGLLNAPGTYQKGLMTTLNQKLYVMSDQYKLKIYELEE